MAMAQDVKDLASKLFKNLVVSFNVFTGVCAVMKATNDCVNLFTKEPVKGAPFMDK